MQKLANPLSVDGDSIDLEIDTPKNPMGKYVMWAVGLLLVFVAYKVYKNGLLKKLF